MIYSLTIAIAARSVDSDVLNLLKQGDEVQAQQRINDIVNAGPNAVIGEAET